MRAQDVTPDAHQIMSAGPSHDEVAIPIAKIRPLRGRAFVEVLKEIVSPIITIDSDPRERKWYRGKVLALGKPACVGYGGPETPWCCAPGDEIVFVLAVWLDRMRITRFVGIKGEVAVLAQGEILAVVIR
jgi:co-chaperonin GroES (HSP10)